MRVQGNPISSAICGRIVAIGDATITFVNYVSDESFIYLLLLLSLLLINNHDNNNYMCVYI